MMTVTFASSSLLYSFFILHGAHPNNLDRKRTVNLDVRSADGGIADLHVITKLEVPALLREPCDGFPVAQGRDGPEIVLHAAVYLARVERHLFPIQLYWV